MISQGLPAPLYVAVSVCKYANHIDATAFELNRECFKKLINALAILDFERITWETAMIPEMPDHMFIIGSLHQKDLLSRHINALRFGRGLPPPVLLPRTRLG